SRAADADVKRPEDGVHRAHLIEAHLVNQLLEDQRIIGKEINTPLPVIETDGTRNDLLHGTGIATAHLAVLFHLPLALFDRQAVPFFLLPAAPVHGIEAQIASRRYLGEESRTHGFALPLHHFFRLALPLR